MKLYPLISDLSKTVADLATDKDHETLKRLRESIAFVFEAAGNVFDLDGIDAAFEPKPQNDRSGSFLEGKKLTGL